MYIHEETICGDTIVIRNHYSSRYHRKGMKRSENTESTSEAQERANRRKDIHELTIRMNSNFHDGDYYITLTYKKSERPPTPEEAKKDRQNFIRRIKKYYKEKGIEPKYILLTGYGTRGAPHHHMVITGEISVADLQREWKPKGALYLEPLNTEGEYSRLATYFADHRKSWKVHDGKGRMWTCSRNIVRPESQTWVVRRSDKYTDDPRPRKNYSVKKDTIDQGYTSEGYPYLDYILVRPPGRKRDG